MILPPGCTIRPMTSQRQLPTRQPLRLPAYDYSQAGAYFVTTCAHGRRPLFGRVSDGVMTCNEFGRLAAGSWADLPSHCRGVQLDAFIVMPNHVHGIIWLGEAPRAGLEPAPTESDDDSVALSEVIRGFKTFSGRRINALRGVCGQPVWQRNYYERVIRKETELRAVREYILNNPGNWQRDPENQVITHR
jgi:putative transposase